VHSGKGNGRYTLENVELLDSAADQMACGRIESHRLRQKAEQLAVMEERNRLARDLHDSVSQALYSMSLLAAAGRRLAQSGQ
jgi:signal transduction histidine kinase